MCDVLSRQLSPSDPVTGDRRHESSRVLPLVGRVDRRQMVCLALFQRPLSIVARSYERNKGHRDSNGARTLLVVPGHTTSSKKLVC